MKTMLRLAIITLICVTFIGGLWIAIPPTEARGGSWTVSVFSNPSLAGSPNYVGVAPSVSYTWGASAPVINGVNTGSYGVPADNFSVRFTTSTFFTAGNYRFTVQVDDGARLYVDGLLLVNQWVAGLGLRTYQADYTFSADGNHTITVEMFDSTGDATIIANWALSVGPLPTATTACFGVPWYAEFFNGIDLAGGVIFTTTYGPSGLNENWGQGSPGGPVPADNFSARFTRTLNVPTDLPQGVYTFYAKADDNFRFTIDATVIIDKWDTWGGDLQTAQATLLNGPHTFKFEYRERTVDASLFLTWTPPNGQCPVLTPEGATTGGGTTPGQPTGITATVNVALLNFRSAPSSTAQILSKLNQGQVYPATGRTADNAWVQLSVGGVTGWVAVQYVTLSGDINTLPVVSGGEAAGAPPPPQPTGVRGRVMGNLRIRSAPNVHSARVGLMPWGTEVDILGIDRGRTWYQVNYNGTVGWSYAPWIRIIQGTFDMLPYTDGTQPAFEPPPATQGTVVQAYGNMRIRSGPGFQYPVVARAVWGSRLQAVGRSSNGLWYKVQYGDVVGFSFASWYRVVQGNISSLPVTDQ
jgi:uncharacterized protein YraI